MFAKVLGWSSAVIGGLLVLVNGLKLASTLHQPGEAGVNLYGLVFVFSISIVGGILLLIFGIRRARRGEL